MTPVAAADPYDRTEQYAAALGGNFFGLTTTQLADVFPGSTDSPVHCQCSDGCRMQVVEEEPLA